MANTINASPTSADGNLDTDGSVSVGVLLPGLYALTVQYAGGTGNVDLQFSLDGGTTKTDAGVDTSVTASGGGTFHANGSDYYLTLSSASSADINFRIGRVYTT